MRFKFLPTVLILAIIGSTPASADGSDDAKALIQAGQVDEAKSLLETLHARNPDDAEILFLQGMIALGENKFAQAAEIFGDLLAEKPDAVRVRLEYARALYLNEDYVAAERQFRRARAGDLPPQVKANIDQYLSSIRYLKTWDTNFSIAVAPDTNINAAPSLHQIDIFGIPFQLSDQARKTSGVGLTVEAGAEYEPLISDNMKLRAGLQMRRSEYPGGDFDDMLGSIYLGPKFIFPRAELSVLATGFRRDFSNTPFQRGFGGRIEGTYILSSTFFVGGALELQGVTYDSKYAPNDRNGPVSALTMTLGHVLSPTSTIRILGSVRRENAHAEAYANTGFYAALGYAQDLPYGFSTYVEPGFWHADYDGKFLIFGKTREDNRWSMRLDLMNRHIEYAGFVPRLSFTLAQQYSNIPFYSYKRQSIELGLVQLF